MSTHPSLCSCDVCQRPVDLCTLWAYQPAPIAERIFPMLPSKAKIYWISEDEAQKEAAVSGCERRVIQKETDMRSDV
mgnify:CR=1 FL=1